MLVNQPLSIHLALLPSSCSRWFSRSLRQLSFFMVALQVQRIQRAFLSSSSSPGSCQCTRSCTRNNLHFLTNSTIVLRVSAPTSARETTRVPSSTSSYLSRCTPPPARDTLCVPLQIQLSFFMPAPRFQQEKQFPFPQIHILRHPIAPAPARETIRVPSKSNSFSSIMPTHQLQQEQFPFPQVQLTFIMPARRREIQFTFPSDSSNSCQRTASSTRYISRPSPTHLLLHSSAPTPARDTIPVPPNYQHFFINHANAPTPVQETLRVSVKSSSRSSNTKQKISLRIGNVFFTQVTRDPADNGYNDSEFVMPWKQEVEFKKVPRTGVVGSPPVSSLTIV